MAALYSGSDLGGRESGPQTSKDEGANVNLKNQAVKGRLIRYDTIFLTSTEITSFFRKGEVSDVFEKMPNYYVERYAAGL